MLYFLAPDYNVPSCGIRTIYRMVDTLNRNGIPSQVLHEKDNFRITWFEHTVTVCYFSTVGISITDDILVIPEIYGLQISEIAKLCRKVIFNQNAAVNTWAGHSLATSDLCTPYLDPQVIAVLCASEEDEKLLKFSFPGKEFYPIRYSVDPNIFYYNEDKRRQISYMTHKRLDEVRAVINMLKFRGNLNGFALVPIENKTETETGRILRESYGFISFSAPEGFSQVAAEALACGCSVVGYLNPEYFRPFSPGWPYFSPCQVGDLKQIVSHVELLIREYSDDLLRLQVKRGISELVRSVYSPEKEEARTLKIWREVLSFSPPPVEIRSPGLPKFSIIVPTWNGLEFVKKCVASVHKNSNNYEMIIIDNASTDGTAQWLDSSSEVAGTRGVFVQYNKENLGFAKAINQGAALARGESLVLLNSDVEVCEGWLEKMAAHCGEGTGAVGAIAENGTWQQSINAAGEEARFITFFCAMIPRKVWDAVGSLDERFGTGMSEDFDYSIRLRRAGYRLVIARDVLMRHEGGASFQELVGGGLGSQQYSDYAVGQDIILRDKWSSDLVDEMLGEYGSPLAGAKSNMISIRTVILD